jgi:chromosome segregation ATPase
MKMEEIKQGLPNWVRDIPGVQAGFKAHDEAILKKRRAARAELDRLQKEAEETISKLHARTEEAKKEIIKAWEEHERKMGKARAIAAEERAAQSSFERQQQEMVLLKSYDPEIDAALSWFNDRLTTTRSSRSLYNHSIPLDRPNPANYKQTIYNKSNYQANLGCIDYLRSAIAEIEGMKLLPECDKMRIEALKEGVPSIHEYTEEYSYKGFIG